MNSRRPAPSGICVHHLNFGAVCVFSLPPSHLRYRLTDEFAKVLFRMVSREVPVGKPTAAIAPPVGDASFGVLKVQFDRVASKWPCARGTQKDEMK